MMPRMKVFLLICTYIMVLQAEEVYKAVNWELAAQLTPIEASSVPRGCTCAEEAGTYTICQMFDCPCLCDLVAGECDPYCCCDTECSAEHIADATDNELCLPEGHEKSTIEYCTNATSVVTMNEKFRLMKNPLGELLCVVIDNNKDAGTYMYEPEYASEQEAFTKNPVAYSYLTKIGETTAAKESKYRILDPIRATVKGDNDEYIDAFGGYLPFPVPSIGSSSCFDANPAQFQSEPASSKCTRRASSLSEGCSSTYAVAPFVQNLYIGKTPDALPSSDDAASYLQVTLDTVREYDPSTDTYSDAVAAAPVYDVSTGLCTGILRELKYTVVHDGNGTIEEIKADVIIGSHTSLTGAVGIEQKFQVVYKNSAEVERSSERNNLMDLQRSGNPGYMNGLPVRVGKQSTDGELTAISELDKGLRIIGPGPCSTDLVGTASVDFGQDIQTSCTKTMTQAEFESYCTENIVPPELMLTATHVAIFGNSDPLTVSEWIDLSKSVPEESAAVYSAATGKCADIITALNIEFLVAEVGLATNPQSKILNARASYKKETWKYSNGLDATQTFLLKTSVSYIYTKPGGQAEYVPGVPPVWFAPDGDIFYPLRFSATAKLTPSITIAISILVWSLTI